MADVSHDPKLSGNLRNLFGNLRAPSMRVKGPNRTARAYVLHTVTLASALGCLGARDDHPKSGRMSHRLA
jgi:hypothetical protein